MSLFSEIKNWLKTYSLGGEGTVNKGGRNLKYQFSKRPPPPQPLSPQKTRQEIKMAIEELIKGSEGDDIFIPVRGNKGSALEDYEILTRRMLDARLNGSEKEEVDICDQLDEVWAEFTPEEVAVAKKITHRLMWDQSEGYVEPHNEKDVYKDKNGVKHWRSTGIMLGHIWDKRK